MMVWQSMRPHVCVGLSAAGSHVAPSPLRLQDGALHATAPRRHHRARKQGAPAKHALGRAATIRAPVADTSARPAKARKTAAGGAAAATRAPVTTEGLRYALRHPDHPPAEAALPQTALPWRALLPVVGPVMAMLDCTTDALSTLFTLRQPGRVQRAAEAAQAAQAGPSGAAP